MGVKSVVSDMVNRSPRALCSMSDFHGYSRMTRSNRIEKGATKTRKRRRAPFDIFGTKMGFSGIIFGHLKFNIFMSFTNSDMVLSFKDSFNPNIYLEVPRPASKIRM